MKWIRWLGSTHLENFYFIIQNNKQQNRISQFPENMSEGIRWVFAMQRLKCSTHSAKITIC